MFEVSGDVDVGSCSGSEGEAVWRVDDEDAVENVQEDGEVSVVRD